MTLGGAFVFALRLNISTVHLDPLRIIRDSTCIADIASRLFKHVVAILKGSYATIHIAGSSY